MTQPVIVGTGGQAREMHALLEARGAPSPVGFLDDNDAAGETHGLPVLGPIEWLRGHPDVPVIVGVGISQSRHGVVERIRAMGPRDFPALVHPSATVGPNVFLAAGAYVGAGAVLTTDIEVGEFALLNFGCTVGHDARIGAYATVAPGANVSGAVVLGEGAEIGTGASILQGVSVGEWSFVGAGAVVIEDVPANVTVVGVPARVVKERPEGWHLGDA